MGLELNGSRARQAAAPLFSFRDSIRRLYPLPCSVSVLSMAQQTNQTQAQMMCSTGCGFYGNPRTGGMCSVCYKEHLQRRGGRSTPPGEKAASPSGSPGPPAVTMEMDLAVVSDPVTPSGETRATISVTRQISKMSLDRDTTDQDDAEEKAGTSSKITDAAADESQVPSDGEQTPDKSKKNRCFTCRKKVGLTGFDCRCGNLFCGIHRYSDKHDCPYDYRGAAVAQIRKENPMVMAEKIQKL